MGIIRWMHISDLHFGHDSYVVDKMRNGILELSKSITPINFLFITGDLRYGKTEKTDYPKATVSFVKDLQIALGLDKQYTYIVPGNHDVNRSVELNLMIDNIKKDYKTTVGEIREETLKYIQMHREPFMKVYEELCGRKEKAVHYSIETEYFNIIHINTAILSAEDGEDGDLIIGTQMLYEVKKMVNSNKPSIVLAHHPFDSLRIEEQGQLEIFLKEHNAVLYLCGHRHVALSQDIKINRQNRSLWLYACGTNMDIDPQLETTDMDIFVGEIDTDKLHGNIQAYKWSRKNSTWMPDSDFSFPQNGALDGKHFFPPTTRPRTSEVDQESILIQYRKYIQFECGEIQLNGLPVDTEIGQRRFALESLFVPLFFKKYLGVYERGGNLISQEHQGDKCALDKIISKDTPFHVFILSGPGGGKTTLLKWIASVYSFPEKFKKKASYLPNRELFPIWIKCRDIDYSSHPTILDLIAGIVRRAEMIIDHNSEEDFIRLVHKFINGGKALLLIDGLDEINDDRDRMNFVSQVCRFVHFNPQINIIVTSRISGFPVITGNQFDKFDCYEIMPFTEKDIRKLCDDWYKIVIGDYEEVRKKAEYLAETIIKHGNIKSLASNPLMLTTLLLVERRVGRLPAKRAALYSEAIQVLLETWNLEAHEPIDLDEARYQLAYIAYKMMTEHKQIITRRDLIQALINVRKEMEMLISGAESYADFIKKVERRSALLIQKGYRFDEESGQTEAVYEFQHLTFQEYLAAYAIANKCYPGAKRDDSSARLLEPYLPREYMKEVVLLSAVLLDRWDVEELVDTIIRKLKNNDTSFRETEYLRSQLLQIIVDEAPLVPQKRKELYDCCFMSGMHYNDINIIKSILKGKYAGDFQQYIKARDMEGGVDLKRYSPVISILMNPKLDVYKCYLENRFSNKSDTVLEALSMLDAFLWMNYDHLKDMLDDASCLLLKEELLDFAKHSDFRIRERALSSLRLADFLHDTEDYARYIDLYVLYINNTNGSVPFVLDCITNCQEIKNSNKNLLTQKAIAAIEAKIDKLGRFSMTEYKEILTLYFVLIQYTRDMNISPWFEHLMDIRKKILSCNSHSWMDIERADMTFLKMLESSVVNNLKISTEKRQETKQYIGNIRDMWNTYRERRFNFIMPQIKVSNSQYDIQQSNIDSKDIDELIKEIDRKLEELDKEESS